MIDIVSSESGQDLGLNDTLTTKAANILSVQIASLEYAQDMGIDLAYFLSDEFEFQNESFRAYLIQVLASWGINVSTMTESINALFTTLNISVSAKQNSTALIAR